ncbi:MAG TPA: hypothetical protein VF157_11125, partial [Chloroflexota bacterium]
MIATPPQIVQHEPAALQAEMAAAGMALRRRPRGLAYWLVVAFTGMLGLAAGGAVGFRLWKGAQAVEWGYAAATAAFLVSSVQAAPAVAAITRLTRGYWATTLRRACDLLAVAGLVSTPLLTVLLYQLPNWKGRPSIWFDLVTAPQAPDAAAVALLAFAGLGMLWLGGWPDRAPRGGTPRHWEALLLGQVLLGSLYMAMLLYAGLVVASDLAVSLVPGWNSAEMIIYQIFTGFEGGLAATIVALACLRRFGGLQPYIHTDVFTALSKLLLGFALLFIWFFWAEFLTFWYGRLPDEKDLMRLFMFGSYVIPFGLSLLANFLLPVALLIWNSVRASIAGTIAVAAIVLV